MKTVLELMNHPIRLMAAPIENQVTPEHSAKRWSKTFVIEILHKLLKVNFNVYLRQIGDTMRYPPLLSRAWNSRLI